MYAIFVTIFFFLFVLLMIPESSSKQAKSMILPSLLFLTVCIWGWIQTTAGIFPDLAHPVWAPFSAQISTVAADPFAGRYAVMRLLTFGMLFYCLVLACEEVDTGALILRIIAVLTTVFAVFGLFAYTTGFNWVLGDLVNGKSVTSTFVNRNSFALFAAFGMLANIAAFVDETADRANDLYDWLTGFFTTAWLFAFGFMICSGALFLTFSRAGIMAAVLGLIAFAVSWNVTKRAKVDWPMMAVCVVVVGLAALANASKVIERAFASSGEEGRFAVYPRVVDAIQDRPLIGHGIGSFHDAFRPYIPESAAHGEWTFAHNTYLETFMELGAPAAILFYFALLLVVIRIYKGTRRRRANKVFSCFALGCTVAVAFHSIFDFSVQLPGNTALWVVILALGFSRGFSGREIRQ